MKQIEDIKSKLQKEGFTITINEKFIHDGLLNCFWHDGLYAIIENNKYKIEVGVYGEIKYNFVDKKNHVDFLSSDVTDLFDYGIDNDELLYKALNSMEDDYYLEMIDNNWIEMPIYDKETGEYITDIFDACAIIPDTSNILEAIDGGITEYIEGFLSYDKEIE